MTTYDEKQTDIHAKLHLFIFFFYLELSHLLTLSWASPTSIFLLLDPSLYASFGRLCCVAAQPTNTSPIWRFTTICQHTKVPSEWRGQSHAAAATLFLIHLLFSYESLLL